MTTTCDTSVLVAALVSWHADHDRARAALADVDVIGAHVLTETYSVLTRLPGTQRLDAAVAAAAVGALPWKVVTLSAEGAAALIPEIAAHRIAGGATYDAVVAATAREHQVALLTRDQRARRTYDALGVDCTLV